jgi:hypothetical protein
MSGNEWKRTWTCAINNREIGMAYSCRLNLDEHFPSTGWCKIHFDNFKWSRGCIRERFTTLAKKCGK